MKKKAMKNYIVRLCYSGYITKEVEAENEDEAYKKAEELVDNYDGTIGDQIDDLDFWGEASEIEEIK